jgi:hypothetical protein
VSSNPVTKQISLGNDNQIVKKPLASNLTRASIQVWEGDPEQFVAEVLEQCDSKTCLSYGVPRNLAAIHLTTRGSITQEERDAGYITRTNDDMVWPEGPAALMLDYDPEADSALTPTDLLDRLYQICGALRESAHIWMCSSSSCIHRTDDDTEVTGIRGQRVYVIVQDGTDIQRAADVLNKRAWLHGYGHIKISKAGSLLQRNQLFDVCVFQPSRIDFCGPPIMDSPLVRKAPTPTFHGNPAALLDTRAELPDLTAAETRRYRSLVKQAKAERRPEAEEIRKSWVEAHIHEYVDLGHSEGEARELLSRAATDNVLTADFQLVTEDGVVVTVGNLFENLSHYHGTRFADPLEPSYKDDPRIAMAFLIGPNPNIYSHAHGGVRYRLTRKSLHTIIAAGARDSVLSDIANFLGNNLLAVRDGNVCYEVDDRGQLSPLKPERVMKLIDSQISLYKLNKEGEISATDCSEQYGKLFTNAYADLLPEVNSAKQTPTIDPNTGKVLDQSGYYQDLKLLITEAEAFFSTPIEPDNEDILSALTELWHPVSQFPYCEPIDETVTLTAMLTAVMRAVLPRAPAFAIDAPVQASGKTLLAQSIALLSGGPAQLFPPLDSASEEETRKRLTSIFLAKKPAIIIDNIVGEFDSPSFAAAITSEEYSDRLLGKSEVTTLSTNTLILFTGNNICFKGDMPRRVYTARIDPKMDRPYSRAFDFDPSKYIEQNLQRLVAAALTLLRAYQVRKPSTKMGDSTASFALWDDVVRKAVCWLADWMTDNETNSGLLPLPRLTDPNDALAQAVQADPERVKLERLLVNLVLHCGFSKPLTIAELMTDLMHVSDPVRLHIADSPDARLYQTMVEIAGDPKFNRVNTRSLGKWLARHRDRNVNGVCLREGVKRRGVATWYVEDVSGEGLAGFEGLLDPEKEEDSFVNKRPSNENEPTQTLKPTET